MPWYFVLLLVLAVLLAAHALCIRPNLPRRDISALRGWDYAHRGLWGGSDAPENSLPAFRKAVASGYGIELDVHLTRDDVLVVFHDDTLERVCGRPERVDAMTLAELKALRLLGSAETIPTLDEVLAVVGGKVPLIVEIKSDKRLTALCEATLTRLKRYGGAYCVESFNPLAVRYVWKNAPEVIRGQLAYGVGGNGLSAQSVLIGSLLQDALSRPDFIAFDERSIRSLPFALARCYRPHLVAWTVRSQARMDRLRSVFDLQIFEGFTPKH